MRNVFLWFLLFLAPFANALDQKKIKATPAFAISDELICTIVQSSEERYAGENLTFIGLKGVHPEVLFESGMTFPYRKLFEDETALTLVLARESKSGAIDSFVIDKKTGKFSRVSAGSIAIPGEGVYSIASLGVCK